MKIKLLTTGLMAGILSVPSVQAAPILSPFGIKTTQFTSNSGFPIPATQNFSTDTAFSNTLDNGSSIAQGNLATGEVGVYASGAYQTDVTIYDTLSFDSATATEVFFDIEVDALLATDSIFEHPRMFMRVGIYDITGLDSWLETSTGSFVDDDVKPVDAAQEVFAQLINIEIGTTSLYGSTEGVFSNGLTSDGTLQYASWSVAESFVFDPAKIYGIGIIGSAYASDGVVDGLNTGVFSFTDLNGTSFTSGSGTFLSAQTAVPIPAAAWMFGSALFGLSALKRKAAAA